VNRSKHDVKKVEAEKPPSERKPALLEELVNRVIQEAQDR